MKTILAAAVVLTLITGVLPAAHADGRDHDRRERRDDRHDRRDDRYEGRNDRRHDRHDERHDRRDAWHDREGAHRHYYVGHYVRPHGYYVRAWRRGDRLPRAWYGSRYVVRDYHSYHLRPPPHGHHWVRVDNDVILAAIATGAVVAIVNDLFD